MFLIIINQKYLIFVKIYLCLICLVLCQYAEMSVLTNHFHSFYANEGIQKKFEYLNGNSVREKKIV